MINNLLYYNFGLWIKSILAFFVQFCTFPNLYKEQLMIRIKMTPFCSHFGQNKYYVR